MRLLPARRGESTGPRGQALIEMALVIPVLLLLVAGTIDLGRVWYAQITITNAAREGALEASRNPDLYKAGQPCADDNLVVCRAVREADNSFVTVNHADVDMTCDAACVEGTAGSPNTVSVTVNGEFTLITPLIGSILGGQQLDLSATATATIAMTPTIGSIPTATPSPTPTPAAPTPTPTPLPPGETPTPSPSPTPTPTPTPCSVPTASFTISPTTGIKNKTTFHFTDTTPNAGGAHCNPVWSWSFGDGGQSSDQNPSHVYDKRGTYTVTLVVSNSEGNSAQYEVDVVVTNN